MVIRRTTTLLGALLLALAMVAPAFAFDFSDTEIVYDYGSGYRDPSTGKGIPQNTISLAHVDGYSLGTNFFNLSYIKWTEAPNNDANCLFGACNSEEGNSEFFGVYRTDFSLNKITKSEMFALNPVIKDIAIEAGVNLETQDATFAAQERTIVFGPQFALNVPIGFLNVELHLVHQWGNNAFQGATNFDATGDLETQWLFPFKLGIVPINFTGFANITLPKGYGRDPKTGSTQTRTEILLHPKLLADVGAVLFNAPGKLEAGFGFEYWLNKFGDVSDQFAGQNGSGTHERTLFFETGYHF